MGGQQFYNNRGGGQQYRQKQQFQGNMGGPQMFAMAGQGMQGMNLGVGPMNFGLQMQGATNQPYQKREYGNLVGLYVGNLSHKTFDLDLYKYF